MDTTGQNKMIRVRIDTQHGMGLDMYFENADALGDAMYHIKYLLNIVNTTNKPETCGDVLAADCGI